MSYAPPLRDLKFIMHEVLEAGAVLGRLDAYAELDDATLDLVAEAAGRFATETVRPLDRQADLVGCRFDADGHVSTPPGFPAAYAQWCSQGWPGASVARGLGGQGLPQLAFAAVHEQVSAGCDAFGMFAAINHCALECLRRAGSQALLDRWLPELVNGSATVTMCLSEPQAGSDLGLLRTRAVDDGAGRWRVSGTKVFASGGEHDLTANIVHLVLARQPDAPAGTRGLSLFLVPKLLDDGSRNAVQCVGIEHKMGLHGQPTCVMSFEQAIGWLVGEPHGGLKAMFNMMNMARLFTGVQAVALGEAAYQRAHAYAHERRQGGAVGFPRDARGHPIVLHPDVQRMLMRQRAWNEGARAMIHWTALHLDLAEHHPDDSTRRHSRELLELLTPIVKGFLAENVQEVVYLALQVHGGHGYVSETGVEQLTRDARITTIYEGTTGIQAQDLLVRKLLSDDGTRMRLLVDELQAVAVECSAQEDAWLQPMAATLQRLLDQLVQGLRGIKEGAESDPQLPYRVAFDFLRLAGHAVMAALWARMALAAGKAEAWRSDRFYRAKRDTARYYFHHVLPEADLAYQRLTAPAPAVVDALDLDFAVAPE